jgi:hypothetical protein
VLGLAIDKPRDFVIAKRQKKPGLRFEAPVFLTMHKRMWLLTLPPC